MSTIDPAVRHDLTDAQWALLKPLVPPASRLGGPRQWPVRGLVDGVRHRVRSGCPWRDVPDRYGPWWRVYALFACWQLLGGVGPRRGRAARSRRRRGEAVLAGVGGLHHRPRPHPRRRRTPRQRGTRCGRARAPRLGSLPRRVGYQDPRRGRPAPRGALVPAHPRPGRRQPTVHHGARADPHRPPRTRTPAATTRASPGRQGLLLASQPRLATPTQDRSNHPVPADQAGHRRRRGTSGGRPPAFDPERYRTDTPSSAASTTSNTTAGSPPDTTSLPSATPPPSTSPASITGSDDFRNRL